MPDFNRKDHWEKIYQTKAINEVSWYQEMPQISLEFIKKYNIPVDASIIDIGGGDSLLVDYLLEMGFTDITVLDISSAALNRAKLRLGHRANSVKWLEADAAQFNPKTQYDFWHDRAAFHFLTEEQDIAGYLDSLQQATHSDSIVVIGTFSKSGPEKCSGISIRQYSEISLTKRLSSHFDKISCTTLDHKTPFDTLQNFLFCSFKKKIIFD